MAEISWPSPDNGRVIDEVQYEALWGSSAEDGLYADPNGRYLDPGGVAAVYADGSTPANVKIRANRSGSVRGFGWNSGDTGVSLTVTANSSGSTRIDMVVLELDRSTWNVRAKIIAGTPGSGVVPTPQRDVNSTGTGKFQVPLAKVIVPNGATSIPAGNVIDGGARIGSKVRPYKSLANTDLIYSELGEISYDDATGRWFGWNGQINVPIYADTGWVNLSINGPDKAAWSGNVVNRIRMVNHQVHCRVAVKRWSNNGLSTSDDNGSAPITVPAQFAPADVDERGFGYHSRTPVAFQIETGGNLRIFPLVSDIPAGRTVFASLQWMV